MRIILILLSLATPSPAQEVPNGNIPMDRIVAAVAMVESGAVWRDTGDIRGGWSTGRDNEKSHWQLTPAVLSDLGLSARQIRQVAASPVYAESVFRLWYSRLLLRTGSHYEALCAFHRGLGGRHRRDAQDYATRVLNIASESL